MSTEAIPRKARGVSIRRAADLRTQCWKSAATPVQTVGVERIPRAKLPGLTTLLGKSGRAEATNPAPFRVAAPGSAASATEQPGRGNRWRPAGVSAQATPRLNIDRTRGRTRTQGAHDRGDQAIPAGMGTEARQNRRPGQVTRRKPDGSASLKRKARATFRSGGSLEPPGSGLRSEPPAAPVSTHRFRISGCFDRSPRALAGTKKLPSRESVTETLSPGLPDRLAFRTTAACRTDCAGSGC